MKKIKNLSKVIIIAILVAMIITVAYPIIVLGANEKNLPVITPMQRAGEIRAGQELKFKITDDTKVSYIFYAWNRRTDGGKSTCIELEKEEPEYEFKINAPTRPGLYEFSIAAEDYYGNTTYWMNIPYIITNNLSGEQDNTAPEFIFNTPNEYPYNDSTIPQEMPITIRAKDPSGIYYIGYKWTRELETKVTGATLVYKKDTVQITAPKEQGVWYLILYARDGSNNLSECYYTRVTVKDQIAPTLTLNGKAEVDVPLNGTFTDEGATFSDNCDATKIVYANEKVDTSKVGEQILTYTATDNAGNVSNTVTRKVTVVAPYKTYELTAPTKTEYKVGDKIDLTGANIKVIDERGNISNVTPTEDMFTGFSTQSVGSKEATFTYEGTSIKYKYEVKALKYDMSGVKFTGTEATYDGTAHNIAVDETTLPEGVTVTGYIGNGQTSAGEHKVKVTFEGDENHEKIEDIEVTLKITPKTITVIAEDKSSEYGAENLENLTARLAVAGDAENGEDYTNNVLVGTDTLESIGVIASLSTTSTTSSNVGEYEITGESKVYGNYTVTIKPGKYQITEKAITVIAEDKTSEYGAENLEKLTARLAVAGDAENGEDYTNNILVGTDTLDNIGVTGTLATTATTSSNVGEYAITGESKVYGNYTVTIKSGTYKITEKAITVIAEDKSSEYGAENLEELTARLAVAGDAQNGEDYTNNILVGEDTLESIGVLNTLTTIATTSVIGDYPITGTDGKYGNYTVTVIEGTYKITKKIPTRNELTYNLPASKMYNGEERPIKVNAKQEIVGLGKITIKYNGETTAPINAGEYKVTVDIAEGENYGEATNIELGTYTITAREITVIAEDKTSVYGAENLEKLTARLAVVGDEENGEDYTNNKLIGTDTLESIGIIEALTTDATTSSNVGEYAITGESKAYGNYTVTVKPGTYKITEKAITVISEDKTSEYGAENLEKLTARLAVVGEEQAGENYTNNTLVGEDTLESIGVTGVLETTATTTSQVGDYPITGTDGKYGNYTVTIKPGTYTITAREITVIAEDKSSEYGAEKLEELTARLAEAGDAENGENYTKNTLIGEDTLESIGVIGTLETTATTTSPVGEYPITGRDGEYGNYTVTVIEGTYKITKKVPTKAELAYNLPASKMYNGEERPITVKAKSEIVGLGKITIKYNGETKAPINAGEYKITVDIAEGENYAEATNIELGTYTITAREITVIAEDKTSEYGAENLEKLTARLAEAGDAENGEDYTKNTLIGEDTLESIGVIEALTTEASTTSQVGDYPITGENKVYGNYTVTIKPGTYKITEKAITVIAEDKTSEYGAEKLEELTARLAVAGDAQNGEDYTKNTLVGTDTLESIGVIASLTTDVTTSSSVGNYPITGESKVYGNYTVTIKPGTYKITEKAITVIAEDKTSKYGAANLEDLTARLAVEGDAENGEDYTKNTLVGTDTLESIGVIDTLETTATTTSQVGEYPITGTNGKYGNYTITIKPGTYTITGKEITVIAEDKTSVYGATSLETLTARLAVVGDEENGEDYTNNILEGTDTLESIGVIATLETTATTSSNVGEYAITGESKAYGNYTVTVKPGTYKITEKAITVIAENKTSVYGATSLEDLTARLAVVGDEQAGEDYTNNTLVGTDTLESIGVIEALTTDATTSSSVGDYAITGESKVYGNYTVTIKSGTYTITAREITVIAEDKTSEYGAASLEELTARLAVAGDTENGEDYTNNTLVGEDTLESIGVIDTLETTATITSVVGDYPITGTDGEYGNYTVTVIEGTYKITKKVPTKAELAYNLPASKMYNGEERPITVKAKPGIVGLGKITIKYNGETTAPINAGEYKITVDIAEGENYAEATNIELGTYTITAREIIVIAEDKTSEYGAENLETLTARLAVAGDIQNGEDYTNNVLVGEDTLESIGVIEALTTQATTTSQVGDYPITGTDGEYGNYTVTIKPGTYTITAREITVIAEDKTSEYGAENLEKLTARLAVVGEEQAGENYTNNTLVGEDTLESIGVTGVLETTATTTSQIGDYPITGTDGKYGNYTVTIKPGTYTITAREITVIAEDKTSEYGAASLEELTARLAVAGDAQNGEDYTNNTLVGEDTLESIGVIDTLETTATITSVVGDYPITGTDGEYGNYTVTVIEGTYKITKKVPTKAELAYNLPASKMYNGEERPIIVKAKPEIVGLGKITIKYNGETTAPINAGEYKITVDIAEGENYAEATNIELGTYTITAREITVIAEDKTSKYGAENLETLTARLAVAGDAQNGEDYTNNVLVGTDTLESIGVIEALTTEASTSSNVGNYPITGESKVYGNYTVTIKPGTYTITEKAITVIAENKTSKYGAANLEKLTARLAVVGDEQNGEDYTDNTLVGEDTLESIGVIEALTTTATTTSQIGDYPITGTDGKYGNYTVTIKSGTYTITAREITVIAEDKTSEYGAASLEELTARLAVAGDTENGEDYTNNTLVGEDTLESIGVIDTLETTATTSSNVGEYPITGTDGKYGNYTITIKSGTYKITGKEITVIAEDKTSVYGAASLETLTARLAEVGDEENGEDYTNNILEGTDTLESIGVIDTLTTTATTNSNVGEYAITGESKAYGNYTVTVKPGKYTITAREITVIAENKTSKYGAANLEKLTARLAVVGDEQNGEDYTKNTLVGTDTLESIGVIEALTTTATTTSQVGDYPITGTDGKYGNYTVTIKPGTYTITAREITVIAEDKSSEYGAEKLEELTARLAEAGDTENGEDYTNNTLVGEDTLESIGVIDTLETTATITSVVGEYPITGESKVYGNYTVTVIEGTYKITKKVPTKAELAYNLPASKMYNGEERPITVKAKPGIVGLGKITIKYNGETTAPINAGEYKITVDIAEGENYAEATNIELGTYTITAREITVIAEDKTSEYGATSLEELTARLAVTGDTENGEDYTNNKLIGTDTLESIGVIKALTTQATTTSQVGDYAITGESKVYGNYTVTIKPGTYTITAREITVIAEDKTSEYGAANLEKLTARLAVAGDEQNGEDYTNNTLVGTDTLESIGVIASLSTTATTSSSVGNYAITGESKVYGNYTVTVKSGTYKITEKAITVIAEDKTSKYGVANLENLTARLAVAEDAENGEDYTNNTLVGEDTLESIGVIDTLTTTATSSIVGDYSITGIDGKYGNYVVTVIPGTYTIIGKEITVIVEDKTSEYGAANLETLTARLAVVGDEENGEDYTNNILEGTDTLESIGVIDTLTTEASTLAVGEYAITGESKAYGTYTVTVIPGTYKITEKAITVIAEDKTSEYGVENLEDLTARLAVAGDAQNGEDYTNNVLVGTDTLESIGVIASLKTTATETSQVGDYPITGTDGKYGNYTITIKSGIYTITTTSIAGAEVEINLLTEEELVYDGTPKVPTVKNVKLNGTTLDKNNDYNVTITYAKHDEITNTDGEFTDEEPVNIGNYKAKILIEGKGNYTGTIIKGVNIPITEKAVSKITITKFPTKVDYKYGEELDLTDGEILVTYNNNSQETIDMSKADISSDYNSKKLGSQFVTISYKGKTDASYKVTVKDYMKGIEIADRPSKIVYIKGQETTLNTEGMKIIALKASEEELDEKTEITTDVTLTGYNLNPTVQGKQTVTVTYTDNDETSATHGEEFTTSFEIVVLSENPTEQIVIVLNGLSEIEIELNSEYVDEGATVYNIDSTESELKVKTTGIVDTTKVGTYTIIYSVEGAEPVTRTVKVVDKIAPVITLLEIEATDDIEVNKNENDETTVKFIKGKASFKLNSLANATDNYDTSVNLEYTVNGQSSNVEIIGEEVGEYVVKYTAKDSSGNNAIEKVIKFIVLDYPPNIYYLDDNDLKVEIEENQDGKIPVYNDYLTIMCDKENVNMYIQKDEEEEKAYNGELLKDGTYTIRVEGQNIATTQRTFLIDTIPPEVVVSKDHRTIKFVDVSDVYRATLTSGDEKTVITLVDKSNSQLEEDSSKYYTINGEGEYYIKNEAIDVSRVWTLRVEDEHGMSITPIKFKIMR